MTTNTGTDNDTKRRAFSPIQMELVERLVREADTRTSVIITTQPEPTAQRNRLAA